MQIPHGPICWAFLFRECRIPVCLHSEGRTETGLFSLHYLYFRKQVLETNEKCFRKPQRPLLRLLGGRDLDRNSITVWKGVGNNVKALAIHANVVGRTVAEVFNPDAIVGNGFIDWLVHDGAYSS